MNLEDLAIKYGTDKKCTQTGNGGHCYTPYYEKHLEKFRNNNINFLELGVREGWSMKMWDEYFPNAQIYGIDNNKENLCPSGFESPKIHFTLCSQDDAQTLTNLSNSCGGFDIIVDDASHVSSLSIKSFNILFPLLRKGGVYVIEDLHVCGHPIYNPENFSTHQFIDTLKSNNSYVINEYLGRKICFIERA